MLYYFLMIIFGIVFAVLLGLMVGSFLNVCIDRLPANQSIVKPPSHCSACGRRLALMDLVPVFSYLFLKGRCRYCGARISSRMMWVELGTGLLFGYLFWHFGFSFELLLALVYCSVFIVLSMIDLDHQLLLDVIIFPTAIIALGVSFFIPPSQLLSNSGQANFLPSFLPQSGIAQAAIGLGIGLLVFTLIIILSRGGMGWGDAKLAGLIGAITGYLVPLAIFIAVIIGGILAIILLVFKLKKRKEGIPFGPFLAIGAVITLLWGNAIASWYARIWQ
jgi:leader peptidase (prepilin peptidase) / N-methyltransferase